MPESRKANILQVLLTVLGLLGALSLLVGLALYLIHSSWKVFSSLPAILSIGGGSVVLVVLALHWRAVAHLLVARQARAGANVAVALIAAIAIWGMINYISSRHYWRQDCTISRAFSISDTTRQVLKEVQDELLVSTILMPGSEDQRQVSDLLAGYGAANPRVRVEDIRPDDRTGVSLLLKRLKLEDLDVGRGVVVLEYRGKTKTLPHSELFESPPMNPYGPPPREGPTFKGEEAITAAIKEFLDDKQLKLYFTAGHGERDLKSFDEEGLSELEKHLSRRENIKTEKLMLALGTARVPADCDILVIVGPDKKFAREEMDILRDYLAAGGRMLTFLEAATESGLESLLREYKVAVGNDLVIDLAKYWPLPPRPEIPMVDDFSGHPIVAKLFGKQRAVFPTARSVAEEEIGPPELTATSLCKTSEKSWAEADFTNRNVRYDAGPDKKGPISLAVAVEAKPAGPEAPATGGEKMRLVVFGDADFITNASVQNFGLSDLFMNSVNWLAARERRIAGISPKKRDLRRVELDIAQYRYIRWGTVAGLPLLALLLGCGVWWRRKR